MRDVKIDSLWDYMVDNGIATDEEISLVVCINGYTEETVNKVLFVRTGYRNWEQYKEIALA